MRRHFNRKFDQNIDESSQSQIFHDVKKFQQKTNALSKIFVRIQFFDHVSCKQKKHENE